MKARRVMVELLPGRIDVVILDGSRRVAGRRLALDTSHDPIDWAKSVRRSGISLRRLVEELGAVGWPAHVLYRSPTQAVDLASFAVRRPGEAVEAATLGCLESLPYSSLAAVCEASMVTRDTAGDKRQLHTVVAAEREDTIEAVVEMIEEAGLRFMTATPLQCAIIGRTVRAALDDQRASNNVGYLHVGEHASFFVVVSNGRVVFDRRIDLGVEALASALTRSINPPPAPPGEAQAKPIVLDLESARRVLRRHGIPPPDKRDTIVDETRNIQGGQIIPLIQPALQRFIVELRQSLRFGVSEDDRSRLSILITGPGAAIPGLAEMIHREAGVAVEQDETAANCDWELAGGPGSELLAAATEPRLLRQVNLQPRLLAQHRRSTRLKRWLWTGATAAVMLIAIDAHRYHLRLEQLREQQETFASRGQDLAALRATEERLRTALGGMQQLQASLDAEIGTGIDVRACMKEISRITPESVRFTRLEFRRTNDRTIATLAGFAFADELHPGRTELNGFIDAMRASPLFSDVTLGNVNIAQFGNRGGQRFETTFMPVPSRPVFPVILVEELAAADERGAP